MSDHTDHPLKTYEERIKEWDNEHLEERYGVEAVVDFWKASMICFEMERRAKAALAQALENFIMSVRFKCKVCGWEGQWFVASHSPSDVAGCTACNPPKDGIIWYDPTKVYGGCPGCGEKRASKS
jgi:predicted RNA-binding Zn-ribbon protein involved in translation (DUF1610 family)